VGPDGEPSEIIEAGSALPLEIMNHADNAAGTVDYAAAAVEPVSGTVELATIRLRGTQPLADGYVRFVAEPGRITDVIYGEQSVLAGAEPARLSVTGYSLWLPIIVSGH